MIRRISLVLLALAFISCGGSATFNGKTYYFSSSEGNDATKKNSEAHPWKTTAKLQDFIRSGKVKPGDRILFKRGDTFIVPDQFGGLQWWNTFGFESPSGAEGGPITLGNYGDGDLPNFMFSPDSDVDSRTRYIFTFFSVSHITLDGLRFVDTNFPVDDKVNPAFGSVGVVLGEPTHEVNNMTIKNCEFSNIGNGITVVGDHNTVTESKFTNLKGIVNTTTPDYEDYGATAITVTGSDNVFSHNYMKGLWSASHDYGWNGGAFEMYEGGHNNRMLYNTIIDTGGIAEYGSSSHETTAGDDIFAYNLIINCGAILWINGINGGGFEEDVRNIQYYNNTIIENAQSRFSGSNTGEGLPSSYQSILGSGESNMIGYGGDAPATWAVLKNNIFILSTGVDVARNGNNIDHQNNLYKISGGGSVGFSLGSGEIKSTSPIYSNTTSSDPSMWDFTVLPTSKSIDAGTSLDFSEDFDGKHVPQGIRTDIGHIEM